MIDLGTIAGLHEHQHELHAYCLGCDPWTVLPLERLVAQGKGSLRLPIVVRCRDRGERGGSAHGVAGSAAVILATLLKAMGRRPNLHAPVKACPPVGVVRIPTFARAHGAFDQWKARGVTRKETQCTQLLRSFAARMAGCDAYRMVGRVASAL